MGPSGDSRTRRDFADLELPKERGVSWAARRPEPWTSRFGTSKGTSYTAVPIRKNIGCDWPYAVRRYNGAGMNSYHYQVKVLKNVLTF